MNCKEVKEFIEIYSDEELQMYDEVIFHLEKCKECRDYLNDVKKTREVIRKLKNFELKQYQLIKKDNRKFNNELWVKIRKTKNKPKPLIFVWFEVAVIIALIGISIWNYAILSKEFMMTIGIIFMVIGMGYTNYKEVENNEGI